MAVDALSSPLPASNDSAFSLRRFTRLLSSECALGDIGRFRDGVAEISLTPAMAMAWVRPRAPLDDVADAEAI